MSQQKKPTIAPPIPQADDFMNHFIIKRQFPVYKYDSLKRIVENEFMTVEKIPMFVNGICVWTHFRVTIKPGKTTIPYNVDIDIRVTVLEGSAWFMLEYKREPASVIVEPGDILIIPAGAEYTILNQSKNERMVYTIDANTLLEME